MLDLYRLLAEHPAPMLRAIAINWQVALWEGDDIQAARQLGDAMLAVGALDRRVAALSPEAREALYLLAKDGGQAGLKSLTLRLGELRRIGPAAIERERPWEDPVSPLEELYYNGLVFRVFGAVPGGHGELLLLPRELLERLPPPAPTMGMIEIETIAPPDEIADDGLALSEDMLALLCHLRRVQPLAAASADPLQPPDWLVTAGPLSGRLVGSTAAPRLTLLWRLLWRLRLAEEHEGRLRPALAARDWLRAKDVVRAGRLYRAWREDTHLSELTQVPTLACDPDGCPHDPAVPRRNLAAFLRGLAPHTWYRTASVIQALKRQQPTFLRPDGDLTSWFIRDAATGQYLRGPQSWESVEGRLAAYLLAYPLHWLGLLRSSTFQPGEAPEAIALSALGAAVLGKESAPGDARPMPLARIAKDGVIYVTLEHSAYERYQLERIALWQSQGQVACYRLTEDAVWEGYNAGITVPQMIAFLKRIGGELPQSLELQLQAWSGRFGRATIKSATLLVLTEEDTAQDILRDKQLAPLIVQALSPTVLTVRPEDVEKLTALLKEKGIWPQRPNPTG